MELDIKASFSRIQREYIRIESIHLPCRYGHRWVISAYICPCIFVYLSVYLSLPTCLSLSLSLLYPLFSFFFCFFLNTCSFIHSLLPISPLTLWIKTRSSRRRYYWWHFCVFVDSNVSNWTGGSAGAAELPTAQTEEGDVISKTNMSCYMYICNAYILFIGL